MSIRAVTDLAAERDEASPKDPTAQFSDILTKTIPTESLTAYTAFIAVVETQASQDELLLPWRWGAVGGFFILTAVAVLVSYYAKKRSTRPPGLPKDVTWGRWAPYELVPVLLATIAWGLAMPGGPLAAQLSGSSGALTIAAIVIVGGALVGLTGTPLRAGTPTPPPSGAGDDAAAAAGPGGPDEVPPGALRG